MILALMIHIQARGRAILRCSDGGAEGRLVESYIEKMMRTGQAAADECHDAGGAGGRVLERAAAFGSVGQRSAGQLALL